MSCAEGTQQSFQHRAALGSISSCTATQAWGRNRNLLVAICKHCLFITFQAATVLHLGLLLAAPAASPAHARVCSASAFPARELPASPGPSSPRSSPQGTGLLLPKSPSQAFLFCCLLPPVSVCSEMGAVRESWCFIPLPAASPSLPSVCAAQGREKAETLKFSLMGRGTEVPSFAKTQTWK